MTGDLKFSRGGPGALLQVQGICKAYGGVKTAQDVSFSLQRGHVHALIGPNGAGKTTMINMLTGIVAPDAGVIEFAGRNVVGLQAHEICTLGMGRTFQNLRLFGDLSVLDNVMLGRHSRMRNGFIASLLALPSSRAQEEAARCHALALLQLVGLLHLANASAGSLSYGLQRRVELARRRVLRDGWSHAFAVDRIQRRQRSLHRVRRIACAVAVGHRSRTRGVCTVGARAPHLPIRFARIHRRVARDSLLHRRWRCTHAERIGCVRPVSARTPFPRAHWIDSAVCCVEASLEHRTPQVRH